MLVAKLPEPVLVTNNSLKKQKVDFNQVISKFLTNSFTSLPVAFHKNKRLKIWLGTCDREFSAGKKL